MPASLEHGTPGLLLGYGIVVLGIFVGLRLAKAPGRQMLWVPLLALPVGPGLGVLFSLVPSAAAESAGPLARTARDLFGIVFFCVGSLLVGMMLARVKSKVQHQRGTRLVDGGVRAAGVARPGELTLAGVPIPFDDEAKHFKIMGTTGTGKSTAIRQLLTDALKRGDRAVIADPDGSYMQAFYDPARGDIVLNPFHERAARWDVFAEIILPHDADQLARSLIPDHEGADRSWRGYARTLLTAILRQMHRLDDRDIGKLYYLLVMAPPEELQELLDSTPAAPFFGKDNGKYFDSVRSVAMAHLAALEHVARQESGSAVSVRRWIREGRGVLFLPYKAGEIAALRQLVSTWMRLAVFETMNAPPGDQRLWFAIDELDALGPIDGLKDALARLRKFGGRCLLGFQSIAQMRGLYGDAEAQTIVENCGNTLILRSSASERGGTAEFASRLIGKREIIRKQESRSRPTRWGGGVHQTRTEAEHHTVEDAVMASEIEQLPDLSGFLKIASRPEWQRIRIAPDNHAPKSRKQ